MDSEMWVQQFPNSAMYLGMDNSVVWVNHDGWLEVYPRENFPQGKILRRFSETFPDSGAAKEAAKAFKDYLSARELFLKSILEDACSKALIRPDNVAKLKKPFSRMDLVKVTQVACLFGPKDARPAYVGRLLKKNGEMSAMQIIFRDCDVED